MDDQEGILKLLIAADMEGISGVTNGDHTRPTNQEYSRFRSLMTADVNAAIEGAFLGGADEISVTDGHWKGLNILIEELDSRVRLNAGMALPFAMVEGIQHGVQGVIFIGYHARMGTFSGVLDHTWSGAKVSNVWLNGRLAGETALNGAVCAHYGAPVLMVSGDQALAAEASNWIPGVETAVVKQATGRLSAECLPPEIARERIRTTAEKALRRFKQGERFHLLEVKTPATIAVEFNNSAMADNAEVFPWARRLDGRRLEIVMPNMPEAYSAFQLLVSMA